MALAVRSTHHWDFSQSCQSFRSPQCGVIYEHLNVINKEFRVLIIRPGRRSEPIVCDLETRRSEHASCPNYEALSYVWGGSPGPRTITLRGRRVPVTKNLRSALRHLRYREHPRVVWIDALCINQDDLQERSNQVRMMRSIYQFASQVIVWLGPLMRSQTVFIDAIFRHAKDPALHWTAPNHDEGSKVAHATPSSLLFLFFNNPWWRRIWTVQEAAVATRLIYVCGKIIIPPDTFKKVAESCLHHLGRCCDSSASHVDALELMTRMKTIIELERLRGLNRRITFLEAFQMNRYREATDPRDMIFGLIGLTSGLDNAIIDYDATIQTIYIRSSIDIINSTGSLEIFNHILPSSTSRYNRGISRRDWNHNNLETENLPSWVPAWSQRYEQVYLTIISFRQKRLRLFQAGKNTRANTTFQSPNILAVEGIDLLRVERLGLNISNSIHGAWTVKTWRQLACIDRNPNQPYVAGGTILDAFWRTLCYDCTMETTGDTIRRVRADERWIYEEWWWSWMRQHYGVSNEKQAESKSQSELLLKGFESTFACLYDHRRFFISSSGYMGSVPSDTVAGDRVCVLLGGSTPYVLRPYQIKTEENGSRSFEYTFVGDAYVHGLMDGEAIDMVEKGALETQTLFLR